MRKILLCVYVVIFLNWSIGLPSLAKDRYQSIEEQKWHKIRSDGLDPGRSYDISSGTGFFISENYIVTNYHVVKKCLNMSIRGAVTPSRAQIVTFDKENDLALLKSETPSRFYAKLSSENALEIGAPLFIIGYPLKHSQTGQYKTLQGSALMTSMYGNKSKIEFDSVIEKGNSGGPLIDEFGSIVGVVQAKKSYYAVTTDQFGVNKTKKKPHKINGIAINLDDLKRFLYLSGASYEVGKFYQSSYSQDFEEIAEKYVVNIHCVKDIPKLEMISNENVSNRHHSIW